MIAILLAVRQRAVPQGAGGDGAETGHGKHPVQRQVTLSDIFSPGGVE